MNYGPLIFLAAFFALSSSWFSFVLTPQVQVGQLQQTNTIPGGDVYPVATPGLARQGLEIYRANGCAYCHSQQIGQTAVVCDVVLAEAGTNRTALLHAVVQVREDWSEAQAAESLEKLPLRILQGKTKEAADTAVKALKGAGAKAELWVVPIGPDIARGWGKRRSVAEDYLFDSPVMLGSQRVGPDLANVGLRLPDPKWHLRHLYAPRLEVKDSTMAPYRFLFETRRIERGHSPDALEDLPTGLAPAPNYEIIPKLEARALVAYLTSLRADAPLFDAPLTVPAPPPAASATNAPGNAPTNAAPEKVAK